MSTRPNASWRRPTSPPVLRRVHDCTSESTDYTPAGEKPQRAKCRDCGRSWTMQYAPSGDAVGYAMRAPSAPVLAGVFE